LFDVARALLRRQNAALLLLLMMMMLLAWTATAQEDEIQSAA